MTMENLEAPIPSTPEFRDYLIDVYRQTKGRTGHIVNGAPVLLVTTRNGDGKRHTVPVYYGRSGDAFIVVASKGGHPEHPSWYRNLLDHPVVEVEVLGERVRCIARTAVADERDRLWKVMNGIWPSYDDYQKATTRLIPVIVLDPSVS